ncbi:hypothetical protein Val02_45510 [Virgisporangium aliadipatigenens]|uniref:Uncharacterized protein n=1 Tax=Virgisporangium aliadipatigenens TaxID=741659 RepID=A0A8J4DR19_9ACTN|nr:hypothetical protein [Virgisporangium aliadipatigenens]GIJ47665.1 hypothetical protein Val02_45510 [Virgisporangium aliadipatigenens]
MDYESLTATVRQLVDEAGEESLRSFGAETVARIVRAETQPGYVHESALTGEARQALAEACRNVPTAGADELRGYLARVNHGVLTHDDMDFGLANLLNALDAWTAFLETGDPDQVYDLAEHAFDQIDFQAEEAATVVDMDDVLATPEMAAEYERVQRQLAA